MTFAEDPIFMAEESIEDTFYTNEDAPKEQQLFAKEPTPEKKPTPVVKRSSAASFLSLLFGGVGTLLISTGKDVPVGRVLQFEAPLAGEQLDKVLAGTFLDNILQPFIAKAEQIEGFGAIIGLPLLIGIYERNPELGTMLEMPIKSILEAVLQDMAPIVKKRTTEIKKAAKSLEDVSEAFQIPTGTNPVDAILSFIFSPLVPDGGTNVE